VCVRVSVWVCLPDMQTGNEGRWCEYLGKYIQVNEVALGKLRSLENVSCTCFYTDNLKLHQDLNHNCINLSSFPNKNTQTHKHTLNTPHFLSIHPFSCGAHARAHTYTHTRLCNSVASSPHAHAHTHTHQAVQQCS